MFAATAARIDADDPLSGLELGERPEPTAPDGWTTVTVKAAALNHHDVWTLRGVGISADRLPIVLGCDAAGIDADGNEVVVHAVIGDPDAGGGDETLDPRRSLLSERYDGVFAERVCVPRRNLVPKPSSAVVRGGRVPADGLPDRVQDAVREVRRPARCDPARAGRGRRGGHRAHRARPRGRLPGVGDQPQRGQARACAQARRRSGLPVRGPAAGTGRRGPGDRRTGHLGAFGPVAQARWPDRDFRCDQRRCPVRPN